VAHSVTDLVRVAFGCVGLEWQEFVQVDNSLFRPAEVEHLVGDASKARQTLRWQPRVSFQKLIAMMVEQDLYRLKNNLSAYVAV